MQMQNLGLWEITAVVLVFGIYSLPTLIAFIGQHKNKFAIFLLNLFLGWTVLGWVGSLVWSVMK